MAPDEVEMAVQTAKERGIKTRAHVANRDAVLFCIDSGVHIIDHGDGFDERCIDRILEKGAYLVPSLWFPKRMMTIAPGIPYTDAMKPDFDRSEEHTSELQSLMRISYAVFCLNKKKKKIQHTTINVII